MLPESKVTTSSALFPKDINFNDVRQSKAAYLHILDLLTEHLSFEAQIPD